MSEKHAAAIERIRFGALGDIRRLGETGELAPALEVAITGNHIDSERRTELLTILNAIPGQTAASKRLLDLDTSLINTRQGAIASQATATQSTTNHPTWVRREEIPPRNATEGPTIIFHY